MSLPNIHFNKGKYPQCGKEINNFSTIYDTSCISQAYTEKPKQSMQYVVGLQTAIPVAIPYVYRQRPQNTPD